VNEKKIVKWLDDRRWVASNQSWNHDLQMVFCVLDKVRLAIKESRLIEKGIFAWDEGFSW